MSNSVAADVWDTIIVLLRDPHYYIANLAGVIFCNVVKKCEENGNPMLTPLCDKYRAIAGNHYNAVAEENVVNVNSSSSWVTPPNRMVGT